MTAPCFSATGWPADDLRWPRPAPGVHLLEYWACLICLALPDVRIAGGTSVRSNSPHILHLDHVLERPIADLIVVDIRADAVLFAMSHRYVRCRAECCHRVDASFLEVIFS